MLFDAISYKEYLLRGPRSPRREAVLSFLGFIERKLGFAAMYPLSSAPQGRLELREPYAIARALKERGILKSFKRTAALADEPPFRLWRCISEDTLNSNTTGMALNDPDALYAALAEGLERYLWLMQWDYFDSAVRMTVAQMRASALPHIAPSSIVGLDREKFPIKEDAAFTWIRGVSLIRGGPTYVPSQTASGAQFPGFKDEPLIRERSTCGLATWPTQSGARLRGILELLERDAYMIMWLNQISPPKIALGSLAKGNSDLAALLERCARYRLKVHALAMPTDAPTHAVCVVVEDLSVHAGTPSNAPRFAVGLKADPSLAISVEKALLEALRARLSYRLAEQDIAAWDVETPADKVGHKDRIFYWGLEKHAHKLEFLLRADEKEFPPAAWEGDTEEDHLARILDWCRAKSYECVSVPLGASSMNPTRWQVEVVVMPDLQPLYLTEKNRVLAGKRLADVPRALGLAPRSTPFTDEPHPFY